MFYHSILGYIFLSLALSIILYLQYTGNKKDKSITTIKKEIAIALLGLIFSLAASLNFVIYLINTTKLIN